MQRAPDAAPAGSAPARRAPATRVPQRQAVPQPPSVPGLLIVATAALVATLVTFGIFLPAIEQIGAGRDPTTLPETISVCDRDWRRDALARELTRGEVFARSEADPIVVEVSLFAACPPGVRAPGGDPDGMATVIYVQTGTDAFVGYALVGGP